MKKFFIQSFCFHFGVIWQCAPKRSGQIAAPHQPLRESLPVVSRNHLQSFAVISVI